MQKTKKHIKEKENKKNNYYKHARMRARVLLSSSFFEIKKLFGYNRKYTIHYMRCTMPRTKRIKDEPTLTHETDTSGKPTEKSISEFLSLFDMEELFGHKDMTKKSEQNNNNHQTPTKK